MGSHLPEEGEELLRPQGATALPVGGGADWHRPHPVDRDQQNGRQRILVVRDGCVCQLEQACILGHPGDCVRRRDLPRGVHVRRGVKPLGRVHLQAHGRAFGLASCY